MILKTSFPLLFIVCLISCNNQSAEPEFNNDTILNLPSIDTVNNNLQITPSQNINQITVPTPAITTVINTNTAGLNPEHGKPGHRCDISVGAPLNSKPTNTPTSTIQPNQPTITTNKTITAPGMNPPHGEPGHRCDISVGTPLNQPVKNKANTPVSPLVSDTGK
jgi:hypothetical protein